MLHYTFLLYLFLPSVMTDCHHWLLNCNPVLNDNIQSPELQNHAMLICITNYASLSRKRNCYEYYCNYPFSNCWELKEDNYCYEVKLKALCKHDIGILQITCLQGWLFKRLVKLIFYLFFFMDFPLNVKFKLIKCFSNHSVNSKWTIYKSQVDSMSGSLYGEAVMSNMLFNIIYKKCILITKPSQWKDILSY